MTAHGADELSRTLRDLRREAGVTSVAAAKAAGIGQAALSRYETGRFVPTPVRLDSLLGAYHAPASVRARLHRIVDDLRAENRRVVVHRRQAPAFQRRIRDIEAASSDIATFQPTVIPGLLQTSAYLHALTATVDTAIAEGVITARRERQVLLGASGHRFTQIVTVGALLWCARDAATMIEQIDHIIAASRLPDVRIGVIPPRRPATVFPLHGFDVYDRRAVIIGTAATTAILTDPADVGLHLDLLDTLDGLADYGDAARSTLATIRDSYNDG